MRGHKLALMALFWFGYSVASGQERQDHSPTTTVPTRLTKQADFGIPFQLSKNPATRPSEVQLYVATAGGQDWKLYQRQRPDAQGFQFRATKDGEYWFAVRTADRNGKLIAHQGWQPEMKVIVDSQAPRLQLQLKSIGVGQWEATWKSEDPNLAPHTFQLDYQTTTGTWQPITVERPAADEWRQEWIGSVNWTMNSPPQPLVVRARILDRAGNAKEVKETSAARAASAAAQAPVGQVRPFDRFTDDRFTNDRFTDNGTTKNWQLRDVNEAPSGSTPSLPSFLDDVRPSDRYGAAADRELWSQDRAPRPQYAPISSSISPPVANQLADTIDRVENPRSQVQYITSPTFALDYDLFDIGPRGAQRVELWITRSGSDQWELYGADADRESPFDVRLREEGLYGFRILVHAFDKSPPAAPRRGEQADFVVGIDWNRPFAKIRRASYEGLDRRSITIEWQADDALLERMPIALHFGPSAQGPWSPIATQLPNSGIYRWRPQQQLPRQVYLKLEVSDRAGNVTTDIHGTPVSRGEPRGVIRGIRPVNQTTARSRFRQ